MLFRDFPDVFASEYDENCRAFASQLESIRGNPLVIGYFMTNEPQWAFVNGFNLGLWLLKDTSPSASLEAMLKMLAERYGSIAALNAAWQSGFKSFEDLRGPVAAEDAPGCHDDTMAFTLQAVERMITKTATACRAVDPDHMNLGLRWAWVHSDYQLAGAELLDAYSINCYQMAPDHEQISSLARRARRPVVIGEFHIGALDRGLPSGGIRNTRTMAESVAAYRYYLENAAALPDLVGAHYFQWNDQHVMGRPDGENMQIGLHDVTGRGYREWEDACRQVHPAVYEVAAGERSPTCSEVETIPQGTLCS